MKFIYLKRYHKHKKPTSNLTFAQAMEAMNGGKIVYRESKPNSHFMFHSDGLLYGNELSGCWIEACVDGKDLTATDWRIVEEAE